MTRAHMLWGLFAIQALCTGYFALDVLLDVFGTGTALDDIDTGTGLTDHDVVEALVTLALVLGLAFTGSELLRLLRRQTRMADQLKVASGAFADLLDTRFSEWGLTDAERDIAILAIKGYAIADMAELRATKLGTVKAQCAALYRKAGVSGRLELLSLFLDDLIAEELIPARAEPA